MAAPFATSVSVTPVQVYVPAPSGVPSVFLENRGRVPVWIGGSEVTTAAGLQLAPRAGMTLRSATQGIYAVSGFTPGTATGTISTNAAQGGSVLTVASGGASFGTGATIVIESGSPRQEIQTVAANTGTTVTTSGTFAFAHGSTNTFSLILAAPALIGISAGDV